MRLFESTGLDQASDLSSTPSDAVSDSNDAYALVPDAIFSSGGSDTACQPSTQTFAFASSSTKGSHSGRQSAEANSSSPQGRNKAVVGGAVAGCVLALTLLLGVGYLFLKRRRRRQNRTGNRLSMPGSQVPQRMHHTRQVSTSEPAAVRPRTSIDQQTFAFRVLNPDPTPSPTLNSEENERFSITSISNTRAEGSTTAYQQHSSNVSTTEDKASKRRSYNMQRLSNSSQ